LIDLGLGQTDRLVPSRLVGMMPDELFDWVLSQLQQLNLPVKFLPISTDMRRSISQKFEQLLLSYLWEGASQQLEISRLMGNINHQIKLTQAIQELEQKLQLQLQEGERTESYGITLDKTVGQFFKQFLDQYGDEIRELTQSHLQTLQGGQIDG
jgi:hypothetical protein